MKLEEILSRKKEREEKLWKVLGGIVPQLREWGALKVILFGSLAQGTVDTWSDLDLLIIMPPGRKSKEWMDLLYEHAKGGMAVDMLIFSQDDFERILPESTFLQEILKLGKVRYEKEPS